MISRVHTFIETHQLILPGDTIVAAISGGIDSMVMLDILHRLQAQLQFKLHVLHVHHGIRGKEADLDQQFVEETCRQKQIPFNSELLSGFNRSSSEEALREARYALFDTYLKRIPNSKMATAHHLDDRLETFLMRLAKGSGVKGLRSIPRRRGSFIRPLLFLTADEIRCYADEYAIAYRTDSSNKDLSKMRNKIREKLTPALLNVFGPDFYKGFAESLHDMEDVYALYEEAALQRFAEIVEQAEDRIRVNRKQYKQLSDRQRRHLLEYCISYFYPLNFGIAKRYFSQFDLFVEKAQTGAVFHFDRGVKTLKERDIVVFFQSEPPGFKPLLLSGPNSEAENRFFKMTIDRIAEQAVSLKNGESNVEVICGDQLEFPLLIRGWKYGDYFFPLGLKRKQKLSDFFVNQKISVLQKKQIPLLINKGEIVWVAGYRLDNRYRVRDDCCDLYKLKVKFKQYT
ncbi:MAG TPA: tRNA lysidine(34) synthetase TilS [Calditrichaeota bacterium]|nr:tRNA lysidine(34) synthetase TilS [Calditrichota bacterium]